MIKITQAKPLQGYKLELLFTDGVRGIVDLSDMIGKGVFAKLADRHAFEQVYIDGGTVAWEGGLDLCPDTLYSEVTGKSFESLYLRSDA
ncbi:MAG TPA: DUF2442 domain-containing protein [Candidatus Kapabacteria bacterium]|nr:DUF2442 domain-containing protein [Candidatus Kapabacteria bacterium]